MLGGWLVAHAGWPTIFYINLPLAAGAIALALTKVTESRDNNSGRTDYAGAALATIGLGGLTYGLTRWSADRQVSAIAVASLAIGAALFAAFIVVERKRGSKAMMPLAMFAERAFVGLNLLTFLLYGAFGATMLLLPYVLISAGGYSPIEAGQAMLPLPIVIALGSPLMGSLAARLGPRLPLTIGPLVVAAGMLIALRIAPGQSYWVGAFPAISVMALGMAIAVAPLTTAILGSVEETHVGTASGLNSAVSRGGGLIATALLGGVLSLNGAALFGGFHAALLVGAIVATLAAACAWFSRSAKPAGR